MVTDMTLIRMTTPLEVEPASWSTSHTKGDLIIGKRNLLLFKSTAWWNDALLFVAFVKLSEARGRARVTGHWGPVLLGLKGRMRAFHERTAQAARSASTEH